MHCQNFCKMINRPFSSHNVNVIDEKTHNSTPATICGQNVMVSQEQHQKLFNTCTTSIAGVPNQYGSIFQNPPGNWVTFTFDGRNPQICHLPNFCHCQPQTGQMQNLNQLQQANFLDLMRLQNMNQAQTINPWRFHLDSHTSTTDLTAATAKVEGNVYDDLEKLEKSRKVNFSCEGKKDCEAQVKLCCDQANECCPKPRKKKRRRSKSPSPSHSSEASSDEEHSIHKDSPKSRDRNFD